MTKLTDLYPKPSEEFTQGFLAAIEWIATISRMEIYLYGRPIVREALEAEKKAILAEFIESEKEIKIS